MITDKTYVIAGLALIVFCGLAAVTYAFLERHRVAWHERTLDRDMTRLKGYRPSVQDGNTYAYEAPAEWSPQDLAYLRDDYGVTRGYGPVEVEPLPQAAPTQAFAVVPDAPFYWTPVPDSTVSGPLPVMYPKVPVVEPPSWPDSPIDTEEFMALMKARTDAWLAKETSA